MSVDGFELSVLTNEAGFFTRPAANDAGLRMGYLTA